MEIAKNAFSRNFFGYLISYLFSFELIFILFLFAGIYKSKLDWFPVDITAVFFGFSVFLGVLILYYRNFSINRKSFKIIILGLAFVLYAILTLAWTPGYIYANKKALFLATVTIWPLISCALVIACSSERLKRFVVLLFVFSLWIMMQCLISYFQSDGTSFINILSANYLGGGRVVGLGANILLAYAMFFNLKRNVRLIAMIFFMVFIFAQLIIGAKGPFVATIIAALIPTVWGLRFSFSRGVYIKRYVVYLFIFLLVLMVIFILLFTNDALPLTLYRAYYLYEHIWEYDRLKYYVDSINIWKTQAIFGHGIGSWPLLYGFGDMREYPHNIILEIMVEFGLVGLLLFSSLVLYAFCSLKIGNNERDPWKLMLVILFTNSLINAMISGDIPDNRFLFGVIGLMIYQSK